MPNTVVKLTNAESTWLEAAREDRKLLINMKAHLQRCAFCLLSFGSRWRLRRLFYWAMPESGILVTSHSYSPVEKGRAKGAG